MKFEPAKAVSEEHCYQEIRKRVDFYESPRLADLRTAYIEQAGYLDRIEAAKTYVFVSVIDGLIDNELQLSLVHGPWPERSIRYRSFLSRKCGACDEV